MISEENFKTFCDWLGAGAYELIQGYQSAENMLQTLLANYNQQDDADIEAVLLPEIQDINFSEERLIAYYNNLISRVIAEIEVDYYGTSGYRYNNGFVKFCGEHNIQVPAYFARLAHLCGYTIKSDYIFYEIRTKLADISYNVSTDNSVLQKTSFSWSDFGDAGAVDYFGAQPGGMVRYESDSTNEAFELHIWGKLSDGSNFRESIEISAGDNYKNSGHTRIKSIDGIEYNNLTIDDTGSLWFKRLRP